MISRVFWWRIGLARTAAPGFLRPLVPSCALAHRGTADYIAGAGWVACACCEGLIQGHTYALQAPGAQILALRLPQAIHSLKVNADSISMGMQSICSLERLLRPGCWVYLSLSLCNLGARKYITFSLKFAGAIGGG